MTAPDHTELFAALCREVGFCLHEKGQARVVAALPNGLDAAMRAASQPRAWMNPMPPAT